MVSQNVGCFLMIRLHNIIISMKIKIMITGNIKYSYIVTNIIHFLVTDKKMVINSNNLRPTEEMSNFHDLIFLTDAVTCIFSK